MTEPQKKPWAEAATAQRAALQASIPPEFRIPADIFPSDDQLDVTGFPKSSKWFTESELEITSATAPDILRKIASQTWSSEDVTRAFCKRAAAAHQLTNCLSVFFYEDAIQTAKSLDDRLRKTGKTVGPLHGLPISLKDNFNIIGKDSMVGFTAWVNDPATYEAVLVGLLRDAGAVLYVKTNVPTAMMIPETVNNVLGRTVNPLNRALTSGGSSGGESALIAFGGSPLGVGTDIGGSLRIPAACTGIFTLRPSFGRFPTLRARSGLAGQEAVTSVNGPMGKTLEDIVLFSKTVVGAEPWLQDPKCLPIPWRTVETKKKLKIAVLWNDGLVTPTPPVQRVLKETVEKLKQAGHEILEWQPTLHSQAFSILMRMFVADGGKSVKKILEPTEEPFRPELEAYEKAQELGVHTMWQLHSERTEFQKNFLDQWHSISGLDAILAPTTPYSSVQNGKFKYVGYTSVYNIVDYSAVSFPTGFVADKDKDRDYPEPNPVSDLDKEVRNDYQSQAVHGIPVSLQLVAQRLQEEKLLDMTATVLRALGRNVDLHSRL